MKFIEYARKLEQIKYLAANRRTGSPRRLARILHTSERTVQRMVQQLREEGHPIIFNRSSQSYVLKTEVK